MKKNLTVRSLSNSHSMDFFLDLVKTRKNWPVWIILYPKGFG